MSLTGTIELLAPALSDEAIEAWITELKQEKDRRIVCSMPSEFDQLFEAALRLHNKGGTLAVGKQGILFKFVGTSNLRRLYVPIEFQIFADLIKHVEQGYRTEYSYITVYDEGIYHDVEGAIEFRFAYHLGEIQSERLFVAKDSFIRLVNYHSQR
jgi:hypothetical protein